MDETLHKHKRCQQRGKRDDHVDLVVEYGTRRWTPSGLRCYMDKRAHIRALIGLGAEVYRRCVDKLNFYVGLSSDGQTIITVANCRKRHRRK